MFDIINLGKGKKKMLTINLSEEQSKSLIGAETVVVTGKANGDTIYVGFREIVVKLQVDRATYKALAEGNKLNVNKASLTQGKVELPTEKKSNPPRADFAHRFPK